MGQAGYNVCCHGEAVCSTVLRANVCLPFIMGPLYCCMSLTWQEAMERVRAGSE